MPRCCVCEVETDPGFANYRSPRDSRLYCIAHTPDRERTQATLLHGGAVTRAKLQVDVMNRVGPDVYFALLEHRQAHRAGRLHTALTRLRDTLRPRSSHDGWES